VFGRKSPFEKALAERIGAERTAEFLKALNPELMTRVADDVAHKVEARLVEAGSGRVEAHKMGKATAETVVSQLGPELEKHPIFKEEAGNLAEIVSEISSARGSDAGPSDIAEEFLLGLFRTLLPAPLRWG
jgi:hypothetical protein